MECLAFIIHFRGHNKEFAYMWSSGENILNIYVAHIQPWRNNYIDKVCNNMLAVNHRVHWIGYVVCLN